MDSATRPSGQDLLVAERVRRRTLVARRNRFVRRVVVLVVLTAGMVVVSIAHRDAQAVRQCRTRADYAVQIFSAGYRDRKLPVLLPHRPGDRELVLRHFQYKPVNDRYFESGRPVGICCCAAPHRLTLRADGRHLVVFERGEFKLLWLTEEEFRRRAAHLHLSILPDQ